MASRAAVGIALGLILVAAGVAGYVLWRRADATPIVGVVRTTEVRVAPEVGGQLASIKVNKGDRVRAGDVVAELSAVELTASVAQARAALAAASASRDHVYAGVRAEEVASLASEIDKAKSRLAYAQAQLDRFTYLARSDTATQQTVDQATNDVASASADVAVLERRLEKTILRAPADGVVSVIVAEVGENIRAGQPVLVIAETGKQWLSFNVREDFLRGIRVGMMVDVGRMGTSEMTPALVTELLPLGSFATWQAERAVGDHDLSTLRLRLDPKRDAAAFEPGMTVWVNR